MGYLLLIISLGISIYLFRKMFISAHRGADSAFSDLEESVESVYGSKDEAISARRLRSQ